MAKKERRNIAERSAKIRRVVQGVVDNPSVTLSIDTLQLWLNVHIDAAERILSRLVSSGLVREVSKGVFVSRPLCS